ncbi:hypothetical protein [Fusobacterium polymorphum]|uniref:hypothetical protein n=1 Tax=Fusobacterium nucleatum subsp. polymorphum TaxID=76857 RepID=UPI002B4BEDD9|nr:hypothetical protein [Fusobacterium polymorphum]WRL72188.1 hypothetical protein VKN77_07470 [Fusobacterium polymorphum]
MAKLLNLLRRDNAQSWEVQNNITDDIFKNIVDKIIITDEKENKNIIMQRIREDEFEKNR